MDLKDFIPMNGCVQKLYCDVCSRYLDLKYNHFCENISGIQIEITGLPVLHCEICNLDYLPDRSKGVVLYIHEQAIKNNQNHVNVTRKSQKKDYGLTSVSFIYDSDDYEYIPGLRRPWDDGFLTPVFFNKEVLLKYDAWPAYRLNFASITYGEIRKANDFSIDFGINKNGKIIMWLGDIATLSEQEQHYLRSENVESDHSVGSQFYDGQLECIFTEPSLETLLFKSRSDFLEAAFQRYGKKIAHLDSEILELSLSFNGPMIETDREKRYTADILNKIHLESLNMRVLGIVLDELGGDSTANRGSIKRLQGILHLSFDDTDIGSLMTPFYVLYDLRVAYSHLGSTQGILERLEAVKQRLKLTNDATFFELYKTLVKALTSSYSELTNLLADVGE